jgi:hypothetical protein
VCCFFAAKNRESDNRTVRGAAGAPPAFWKKETRHQENPN